MIKLLQTDQHCVCVDVFLLKSSCVYDVNFTVARRSCLCQQFELMICAGQ